MADPLFLKCKLCKGTYRRRAHNPHGICDVCDEWQRELAVYDRLKRVVEQMESNKESGK